MVPQPPLPPFPTQCPVGKTWSSRWGGCVPNVSGDFGAMRESSLRRYHIHHEMCATSNCIQCSESPVVRLLYIPPISGPPQTTPPTTVVAWLSCFPCRTWCNITITVTETHCSFAAPMHCLLACTTLVLYTHANSFILLLKIPCVLLSCFCSGA
jgi:hypothetical protein